MIPTSAFTIGDKAVGEKRSPRQTEKTAFSKHFLPPSPVKPAALASNQGSPFRHVHNRRTGNLVVPRLLVVVESHPNEAKPGDHE